MVVPAPSGEGAGVVGADVVAEHDGSFGNRERSSSGRSGNRRRCASVRTLMVPVKADQLAKRSVRTYGA